LNQFLAPEEQREVNAAFEKIGSMGLSAVFQSLGGRYDYGRLRLLRAALNQARPAPPPTQTQPLQRDAM